jgi:hypothetical protein
VSSYVVVLTLHSWSRWVVLVTGAVAVSVAARRLLRREPIDIRDRRWTVAFVASLDTQILLGLLLYLFLSPMAPRSGEAFRTAMKVSALRFFAVEHVTAMVLGAVMAHVASATARRMDDPAKRHRRLAVGLGAALLLILIGIPWPGLPYGRPLFRFLGRTGGTPRRKWWYIPRLR